MVARRMSLIAFAIRLVSAAIAFVSQILLARWMGDFEYGIFVLVWTAAIIAGNLSCFGFATSIIRFVPQYRATGSNDELRGKVNAFLADYRARGGFGKLGDKWLAEQKAEFQKLGVPFLF